MGWFESPQVSRIGIEPKSTQHEPFIKLGILHVVLRLDFLLY